jgi:hypothetical protein
MSDMLRNKLDAMIHNIGYPELVINETLLLEEIDGVGFASTSRDFFP